MVTEYKESAKCLLRRDCESKTQTVFSDEQVQEKSPNGNFIDLSLYIFMIIFLSCKETSPLFMLLFIDRNINSTIF